MTIPTQYEIDKALVFMAIKSALSDFGKGTCERLLKKLVEKDTPRFDWFENPEYFKNLLKEEFDSSYTITIIHSMQIWLGDSSSNKRISDFLVAILGKPENPLEADKYSTKFAIVLAIEKSLLKMGTPELKRVETKLLSDFNYTLEDCVFNPIPLKKVLCELFGYCYNDIYQSMTYTLRDTSMNDDITKFLQILKE